jgi:hypothetical protein
VDFYDVDAIEDNDLRERVKNRLSSLPKKKVLLFDQSHFVLENVLKDLDSLFEDLIEKNS